MSRSPQLYSEDTQEIFVAIPPPLVPPLARQLSSSQHGSGTAGSGINNPQELLTPATSTDNSFEQWTSFEPLLQQHQLLLLQQQRAIALLGGDRTGAGGSPGNTTGGGLTGESGAEQNRGQLPPVETSLDNNNRGQSTTPATTSSRPGLSLNTPVSSPPLPPPISLPIQLLNRLYPFSNMSAGGVNPSADNSCASSSAGSYSSRTLMSGVIGSSVGGGFGSRSSSSLHHQQPDLIAARRNSTELARTAAATAIVNTLVSRGSNSSIGAGGGEAAVGLSIPRGDSPYIPSSLSMLFSDPEIMQVQNEVEEYNNSQQGQQGQQRRTSNAQLTLSHSGSGVGSGIFAHSEDGNDHRDGRGSSSRAEEGQEEDDGSVDYGEESRLLQDTTTDRTARGAGEQHMVTPAMTTTTTTTNTTEAGAGYGYEIVQEDLQDDPFRPYVAMMARDDYLAPHEPSSSSPLFPSPLTTLGGYSSGASMLDVAEDQQAQAAGRIWRDYGTMMENGQQYLRQHNPPTATQSHAAYYHAVSNYHYSYNSGNPNDGPRAEEGGSSSGSGSTSQVNPCVPTGHYAIPESWQWRRHRGRGASNQSYGGANNANTNGSSSGTRRRNGGDGSDDNWLWGILVSVVSCWVCCESPAACCSSCCL